MSVGETTGLLTGADGAVRCAWCGEDAEYQRYHDEEWGRPVDDDDRLYEKICLEGFQAGLSWLTILRKRPRFRAVFADFDPARVARFTERDVLRLLGDAGIVRHRGKIESTINNARRTIEIVDRYGSLASFLWRFRPDPARRPKRCGYAELGQLATTPESAALSRALRQHGFSFVGPTTMYALMQSVGLVNDHLDGCVMRPDVERAHRRFRVPAPPGVA